MTTIESDHDGSTMVGDKRDDTVKNGNPDHDPHGLADAEGQVTAIRHPRAGMAPWKWPCALASFGLYLILNGYDVSNIANIQPPIYDAFGHVELLPWVGSAFSGLATCVILLCSRMSAFLPLKRLLIIWQLCLFAGSVVAGSANSMNAVIIGRALGGIGSGGNYATGMLYIYLLSTPLEFPTNQALIGVCWAVGLIIGPVIGAALAENQHATWRWAIYLNLPVIGFILAVWIVCLPSITIEKDKRLLSRLAKIDWIGAVLHFSLIVLFLAVLIFSGSTWVWNSGSAIAAWVVVGLIAVCYGVQQALPLFTTRSLQMIPVRLLTLHRSVALVFFATAGTGASYGAVLYYTPIFYAFTRSLSTTQSAVRMIPFLGAMIVSTIIFSIVLTKVGRYAPLYILSGACVMAGAGPLTQITPDTSQSKIMGLTALVGVGIGLTWQTGGSVLIMLVFSPRATRVFGAMSRYDRESLRREATALFGTSQLGGVAIALGLAGCIYQNVGFSFLKDNLAGFDVGRDEQSLRDALAGADSSLWTSANPQVVELAIDAVVAVIGRIFWLVFVNGAVCFLAGCAMPFELLDFAAAKGMAAKEEANMQKLNSSEYRGRQEKAPSGQKVANEEQGTDGSSPRLVTAEGEAGHATGSEESEQTVEVS